MFPNAKQSYIKFVNSMITEECIMTLVVLVVLDLGFDLYSINSKLCMNGNDNLSQTFYV